MSKERELIGVLGDLIQLQIQAVNGLKELETTRRAAWLATPLFGDYLLTKIRVPSKVVEITSWIY